MDYLIGEIELFPYNQVPYGWRKCNGDIMMIVQNTALFSLIGTMFGGDGKTTFALPNLLNDSPLAGMDYYMCIYGIYPMRS
jgi:microcystin-dependent protein